jgi:magnesium and cobalt exporter, CNNM family
VSDEALLIVGLLLPVALFVVQLFAYSLRDFSRSALDELCQRRGKPERFSSIMHHHERAMLLCDGFCLTIVIATAVVFSQSTVFGAFRFPQQPGAGSVSLWSVRWILLFVASAGLFVGLPWAVSRVRGERLLAAGWPLLAVLVSAFRPFWRVTFLVDRAMHRIAGLPDPDSAEATTILEDELRTVVDEGRREGVIHSNASRMIHRVVDLQDEDVASIMTPRTDMVTIPAATPLNQALEMVVEHSYSRIPITGQSIDDIVGVLYARDLLAQLKNSDDVIAKTTVGEVAREVVFVPESQRIGLLLENMQQKKVHMAIVVDEYSGVAGLVSLEDVLEEIVGEIADEHDDEEHPLLTVSDDGSILVDGRIHIDDLNRDHGFQFPEDEEYDTIGGFMMSEMARIPSVGEFIHWNGTTLEVTDADERQLKQLHLIRNTSSTMTPSTGS